MTLKRGCKGWRCVDLDKRLRPYVGSGMTLRQVGALLGVTDVAVFKALRVRGWSLTQPEERAG